MVTLRFKKDSLIALCGASGSGKSFFARTCFAPGQIVSSDQCRQLICDDAAAQHVSADAFELFYMIIGFRLKYGRLTVADATHLTSPYRRRLIDIAATHRRPIYLVLMEATLAECLRHNTLRGRQVEDGVIAKQLDRFNEAKSTVAQEGDRYADVYELTPEQAGDVKIELE